MNLPTRVKLLGWGLNETANGRVIVDELTAHVFDINQKKMGRERVVVDFEHNTVPGTPEYQRTTEPRNVAGHSALVVIPKEGIYADQITYTAVGQTHAANYEDVSLAPFLDKEGRVIAAHSWAVTHTGAAYDIRFQQAVLFASEVLGLSAVANRLRLPRSLAQILDEENAAAGFCPVAVETVQAVPLSGGIGNRSLLPPARIDPNSKLIFAIK